MGGAILFGCAILTLAPIWRVVGVGLCSFRGLLVLILLWVLLRVSKVFSSRVLGVLGGVVGGVGVAAFGALNSLHLVLHQLSSQVRGGRWHVVPGGVLELGLLGARGSLGAEDIALTTRVPHASNVHLVPGDQTHPTELFVDAGAMPLGSPAALAGSCFPDLDVVFGACGRVSDKEPARRLQDVELRRLPIGAQVVCTMVEAPCRVKVEENISCGRIAGGVSAEVDAEVPDVVKVEATLLDHCLHELLISPAWRQRRRAPPRPSKGRRSRTAYAPQKGRWRR